MTFIYPADTPDLPSTSIANHLSPTDYATLSYAALLLRGAETMADAVVERAIRRGVLAVRGAPTGPAAAAAAHGVDAGRGGDRRVPAALGPGPGR
jgi:hypothetical protein